MSVTTNPVAAARRVLNRSSHPRGDWCSIVVNAADGQAPVAEIRIYDEIGFWGTTAADFANQIGGLAPGTIINLRINSPGGEVYDGIAILNAIRRHEGTVNVYIDGLAASSASWIAMGGDRIVMGRNTEMMIHEAQGLVMGAASDMAAMAAQLEKISENIASIYAGRAGGTIESWRAAMKAETWYSAQEAVDAGLADEVDPAPAPDPAPDSPVDQFDLSVFNFAGRAAAPAPASGATPVAPSPAAAPAAGTTPQEGIPVAFSDESTKVLRQQLGVADDADEVTILAALDEALAERAEPQPAVNHLPDGVVAIDATQLADLRAAAQAGADARARQVRDDQERIVDQAIATGRIAPARRDAWLNRLAADPAEADTLNGLEPGLIPLTAIGSARPGDPDSDAAAGVFNDAQAAALAGMIGVAKGSLL